MPDKVLFHRVKGREVKDAFFVEKIADGLGYGTGSISRQAIEMQSGSSALLIDTAIQSPELLIPLDEDRPGHKIEDDGCGDGRQTFEVLQQVAGVSIRKSQSLQRAKVFGGGAVMATATQIGSGREVGLSLQEVFERGVNLLKKRHIDYGAHTAVHINNPSIDSGCGAIDNVPAIVASVGTYRDNIYDNLKSLGVTFDESDFIEVVTNFMATAAASSTNAYSGKSVMKEIIDDGKIVKRLEGSHLETRIVLNFVSGFTVNQKFIRETTKASADAFAVDVWRIQEIAVKLYPDDARNAARAVLSELIYTLATAAVLTKGDLPVYTVRYDKAEVR